MLNASFTTMPEVINLRIVIKHSLKKNFCLIRLKNESVHSSKNIERIESAQLYFTNAAKNTGFSKTVVMDVFDQYVELRRSSLTECLCIDVILYSRHSQEKKSF